MASRTVTRTDRREKLGVGQQIDGLQGSAKWYATTRNAEGRLVACLDYGDHRTRVEWSSLVKDALSQRRPPAADAFDDRPAPILAELPEDKRAAITKRYRDLLHIKYGSPRGDAEGDRRAGMLNPDYDPVTTSLPERLQAKQRELRALGEARVAKATIYRQLERLDEGPDFLIHGNRRALSQRLNEYEPLVLEIVRAEVDAEQKRPRKSQRKLLARVRSRLMGAHLGEELTRHQLSVLVGEVSRGLGLHHPAKTRRSEASRPVGVYGTRRVSRPGELVQVDATPTTVAILGPLGIFVPAVILTAIDVYDRWFVALRVCVGAATSRDVCALIAQMGRPTVTRAGYPYELEQWHGIPELVVINDDPEGEKTSVDKVIGRKPAIHPSTIVFDHGSENASDHVMRYAAECGIDVVFCPPRRGHAKGIVESVHRMIGDVESTMPIHKGQNVLNRPVDLECDIPIKPQDLQDMLWEYVIDIYAHEEHRSLAESLGSSKPLSPAMVWADYVTNQGEIDVPTDPFVFLKGLERDQRILTPAGIRLNKVTYNSSELQALRSVVMSGIGTKARPLPIFFDRFDITRIFLVHPVERHWLMVPRAADRNRSTAPLSGLVPQAVLLETNGDTRRPLTEDEMHRAESAQLLRWREGIFTSRQDARFAAIEDARQRTYAHDLEQASEEVRALAFPTPPEENDLQVYPKGRDDDDEIDFEEDVRNESIDGDEPGWGEA